MLFDALGVCGVPWELDWRPDCGEHLSVTITLGEALKFWLLEQNLFCQVPVEKMIFLASCSDTLHPWLLCQFLFNFRLCWNLTLVFGSATSALESEGCRYFGAWRKTALEGGNQGISGAQCFWSTFCCCLLRLRNFFKWWHVRTGVENHFPIRVWLLQLLLLYQLLSLHLCYLTDIMKWWMTCELSSRFWRVDVFTASSLNLGSFSNW